MSFEFHVALPIVIWQEYDDLIAMLNNFLKTTCSTLQDMSALSQIKISGDEYFQTD